MVFVILNMVWPNDGILNAETGCHIIFYYFTLNNKTCWSLDGSFYYIYVYSVNLIFLQLNTLHEEKEKLVYKESITRSEDFILEFLLLLQPILSTNVTMYIRGKNCVRI
jgi:hypothetical protein